MNNLSGKNIILTGASSGIGKEMLNILSLYSGIKVIAVARHIDTIPQIEGVIYPFAADVSNKDGVDSVFDYVQKTFGSIDVFIANAGFAYLEKLDNPDWQHIENIYTLNVFSPVYSLERLVKCSRGKTVTFACTISGAGLVSLPAYSLYCSTKAALHHFIRTYSYEQSRNVHITAVYPVATRTEFFDKATGEAETPLPFPTQNAATVARKIIRGIEKGKKNVYPSMLFRLFYPLGRAFPVFLKIYSLSERRKVKRWL
jgi:short-subunit dehydrogenase